jgi:hypothetical protein
MGFDATETVAVTGWTWTSEQPASA